MGLGRMLSGRKKGKERRNEKKGGWMTKGGGEGTKKGKGKWKGGRREGRKEV